MFSEHCSVMEFQGKAITKRESKSFVSAQESDSYIIAKKQKATPTQIERILVVSETPLSLLKSRRLHHLLAPARCLEKVPHCAAHSNKRSAGFGPL